MLHRSVGSDHQHSKLGSALYVVFPQVSTSDPTIVRFASVSFSSGLPVLVTIQLGAKVTINSEKMVINSMLLKAIKTSLTT